MKIVVHGACRVSRVANGHTHCLIEVTLAFSTDPEALHDKVPVSYRDLAHA